MDKIIVRKKDRKVAEWSGGTTSELFIYPNSAIYQKLDFLFRLSIATIVIEESIFTPLANVRRKLMLLEGEIELVHKNHHSKSLKPLMYDSFLGNWETTCLGTATDFNLMLMGNTKGEYNVIQTEKQLILPQILNHDFTIVYIHKGGLKIDDEKLLPGDLLIFKKSLGDKCQLDFKKDTEAIMIDIDL